MIRAYPHAATVVAGGTLTLHVAGDVTRFRVSFVRCGSLPKRIDVDERWFVVERAGPGDAGVPWNWPPYRFDIPQSCRGGAYVAVLETDADRSQGLPQSDARSARAFFVVREETARAALLIVLPLFTYHAYNVAHVDGTRGEGEGECLYSGAKWVTLHRPGGGVGGHPWDEVNSDAYDRDSPRQTFAHWDAKALAWLEKEGYPYDCCTDLDLHEGSVDLAQYAAIGSFGHHEYWSQAMRARIDAYIAGGGNVAFFGANTSWFQVEYDAGARAIRRMGRWTSVPEWKTTGVSYAFGGGKWIGPRPAGGYAVTAPGHWIFDGLNLAAGDAFGCEERLLGYECDGAPRQSDLHVLAQGSLSHWPVEDGSGEIAPDGRATLGVRSNNGMVFTASTVDWARVLHTGQPHVQGITRNVLNRFLR